MKAFRIVLCSFFLTMLLTACAAQPGYKGGAVTPEGATVLRLPGNISFLLPRGWESVADPGDLASAPVVAAEYDKGRHMRAKATVRDMETRAGFDQQTLRDMPESERKRQLKKNNDAVRIRFGEDGDVFSVVSRWREVNGYICLLTTVESVPAKDNPDKASLTTVQAEYLLGKRYVAFTVSYATSLQNTELDGEIETMLGSFNPETK